MFSVHHSSVQAQCDRYRIYPVGDTYALERIAGDVLFKLVPPEPKWKVVGDQLVSQGKSYREYLKEAQLKRTTQRVS